MLVWSPNWIACALDDFLVSPLCLPRVAAIALGSAPFRHHTKPHFVVPPPCLVFPIVRSCWEPRRGYSSAQHRSSLAPASRVHRRFFLFGTADHVLSIIVVIIPCSSSPPASLSTRPPSSLHLDIRRCSPCSLVCELAGTQSSSPCQSPCLTIKTSSSRCRTLSGSLAQYRPPTRRLCVRGTCWRRWVIAPWWLVACVFGLIGSIVLFPGKDCSRSGSWRGVCSSAVDSVVESHLTNYCGRKVLDLLLQ
jgi:hypothetical protein